MIEKVVVEKREEDNRYHIQFILSDETKGFMIDKKVAYELYSHLRFLFKDEQE